MFDLLSPIKREVIEKQTVKPKRKGDPLDEAVPNLLPMGEPKSLTAQRSMHM